MTTTDPEHAHPERGPDTPTAALPQLATERALLAELETDLAAIDAELRSLDGTT